MSSSPHPIQPVTATPVLVTEVGDIQAQGHAVNPLRQVHALLRGRYWLAVVLGLLGAVAGAYAGYTKEPPLYESSGLVRVQPYVPRILYENEQNGLMPMFDAFINSQMHLMQSERVLTRAMEDLEWAELGRGDGPEQLLAFRGSLLITRPKSGELVRVRFKDRDPAAAQIAVNSVIGAYETLYGQKNGEDVGGRIEILEQRQAELEAAQRACNNRILELAQDYGGATALDQVYQFKLGELNKLESELRRAELALALTRGTQEAAAAAAAVKAQAEREPAADHAAEADPAAGASQSRAEVLALQIPELRSLLEAKRSLERELRVELTRYGPSHGYVARARADLAAIDEQIQEIMNTSIELGLIGFGAKTLAQLAMEEQNIRPLYDRARKETLELGRLSAQIELQKSEAAEIRSKLDDTKRRLEQLMVEQQLGGRISVESLGDYPLVAVSDKRKKMAAVGGLGLGMIGVGLVVLLGLFDRRVRGLSDVSEGFGRETHLLGVLPHLPENLADPEQAMVAAQGVHQIRGTLQGRHRSGRVVTAITSPSPGAGKTSLSLALGLSYAASGSRTLLIDCDIVGGGLTAKMKNVVRRRIGHVLKRLGIITSAQLVEALKLRAHGTAPIGEVLVDLGYAMPADIERARDVQRQSRVGLREALEGEPVHECIAETGTPGLFLLPLGSADRRHAAVLSQQALGRILTRVRAWFDVVLIDTGPVIGSLEACIAAQLADEVVLTIARGESRPAVERSLAQLHTMGVQSVGVVLNHASPRDLVISGFSSSASRASGHAGARRGAARARPAADALLVVEHKGLRLGPIGSAVASVAARAPREN